MFASRNLAFKKINPHLLLPKRNLVQLSTISRVCQPNAVKLLKSSSRFGDLPRNLKEFNTSIFNSPLSKRFYSSDFPPHTKILMPALSPTMSKGNILSWNKKEGDQVKSGDVLVSIETDKATMDFEAQEEGYLAKILIQNNAKDVSINTPLAIMTENKDDISKFADFKADSSPPKQEEKKQETKSEGKQETKSEGKQETKSELKTDEKKQESQKSKEPQQDSDQGERKFVSPIAKKLASEKGVNLDNIKGSGPNGRVVLADVEAYLSKPQEKKEDKKVDKKEDKKEQQKQPQTSTSFTDIPLSNIRKVIASRLTQAKQEIPHYYVTVDINVDKVLRLREELNSQSKDYKLSINDFIIKASALTLIKIPQVNSSWQGEFIRQYNAADISVAVATPTGLITPIVFNAQSKGLVEISNNVKDLASRAKEGKLALNEFQGGTFTISNLGMYGVSHFTAIINPPQSCILAIGGTRNVLAPSSDPPGFSSHSEISVTLSSDHRVVDGALAATWLQHFKSLLQNPTNMLL